MLELHCYNINSRECHHTLRSGDCITRKVLVVQREENPNTRVLFHTDYADQGYRPAAPRPAAPPPARGGNGQPSAAPLILQRPALLPRSSPRPPVSQAPGLESEGHQVTAAVPRSPGPHLPRPSSSHQRPHQGFGRVSSEEPADGRCLLCEAAPCSLVPHTQWLPLRGHP